MILSHLRTKMTYFYHFWSKSGQFQNEKKPKNVNLNSTNHISTKEMKNIKFWIFFGKKAKTSILRILKLCWEKEIIIRWVGRLNGGFFHSRYFFRFLEKEIKIKLFAEKNSSQPVPANPAG